jgi:hypothetical protein
MKHVVGVNPLQTTEIEQGAVRMRDSLLNRDAEAHPSLNRFVRISELFFCCLCPNWRVGADNCRFYLLMII